LWGVQPLLCEIDRKSEDMVMKAEKLLLRRQAVQANDVIAIVAGPAAPAVQPTSCGCMS